MVQYIRVLRYKYGDPHKKLGLAIFSAILGLRGIDRKSLWLANCQAGSKSSRRPISR